jgi:HlyD family secretion protein
MASFRSSWRALLRRIAGVGVLVGIVLVLVLASLPQPVPVELATASRGPIEVTVEEDGRAQVKERYTVSAPLTGNLARIELEPGDTVEAGAPVAYILPVMPALLDVRSRAEAEARLSATRAGERQTRSAVARAEAALALARAEAARQEALLAQGGASAQTNERASFQRRAAEEELESARFAARVASHEVRMAEAALGTMTGGEGVEALPIPSPIEGKVLRVLQPSEGVVQAGTPLVEVGDPSALELVVDILTTDAVPVHFGNDARIVHWGGEGALAARVRRKEPSAFTSTSALGVEEQRVNVILDLVPPLEPTAALGDGYRIEAVIVVDRAEDVLQVPAGAVFRHGEGWAVFRASSEAAELVPIEVGRRGDRTVEITRGLSADDRVVLYPSDRVVDGAAIEAL